MTTLKRIFCEFYDGSVRFSKDCAAMSLQTAEKYTDMPTPLLRLFEFAFYQLTDWTVKLCSLYEMGLEKNERYGMLVSTTKKIPDHVKTDLMTLDIGIEDFGTGDATILFIPAGLNDSALATVLFILHTRKSIHEFASVTYEADPPSGAGEVWAKLAQDEGLPKAFNPGITDKYDTHGAIYIRFTGVGQENAIVQQEGWHKFTPPTEQERCNLIIRTSDGLLDEKFDNNLLSMAKFLRSQLSRLSRQAQLAGERISWRNLVFRLFNSELPGCWDTATLRENVSFTLEVK